MRISHSGVHTAYSDTNALFSRNISKIYDNKDKHKQVKVGSCGHKAGREPNIGCFFVRLASVYYISYGSLQSFVSSEHSVKEFYFISYLLFSHNY